MRWDFARAALDEFGKNDGATNATEVSGILVVKAKDVATTKRKRPLFLIGSPKQRMCITGVVKPGPIVDPQRFI